MAFRRGFKTEANSLARSVRSELGLPFEAPLNPWRLAEHLEIPIIALSDMRDFAALAATYFSSVGESEFSAVTVFEGTRRIILHNDSHSLGRQASDLAHELAHGMLLHSPGPALDEKGCRNWNKEMEDEADWLSGALLISEEAALSIIRRNMSVADAAVFYGVSEKLVKWRLQVTGAYARVIRTKKKYSRSSF
jgi:Zn-dependent peptidase ImmA (M78 family)